MIISIIIVLCVAAAVAAYGLINGNDATFSNLAGVDSGGDSGSGTGHGNNTTNLTLNSLLTGSGTSASSGSGSGSGSGTNSGSGSGSGSSDNPPYNPNPSPGPIITPEEAKEIVNGVIKVIGWYAGEPTYDNATNFYYVPVYNAAGDAVDIVAVNATSGWTDRG